MVEVLPAQQPSSVPMMGALSNCPLSVSHHISLPLPSSFTPLFLSPSQSFMAKLDTAAYVTAELKQLHNLAFQAVVVIPTTCPLFTHE